MPTNAKEFIGRLEREGPAFVRKASVAGQKVITVVAIKRMAERTPVDTTRTQSGWQVSIGSPSFTVLDRRNISPSQIASEARAALTGLRAFQLIWMVNNEPAAQILDEGLFEPKDPGPSSDPRPGRFGRILVRGGFSTQASAGMVALTLEELRALVLP